MKVAYFIISLLVTTALVIVLNTPFDKIPAFGKFLSPQHGFWQNAEPVNKITDLNITAPGSMKAEVYFDNRMVPHIFAEDERSAYYMQGYLHAKYRLWQMEFQTIAAEGRLAEILGAGPDSAYLNNDRRMRRMGMVFGARRSLAEMEKDAATKQQLDAYTSGVNNFIEHLPVSQLPLEYRLLNYTPEKWSNYKTSLLLMYLSLDLTGGESDVERTNVRTILSESDYNLLFPEMNDSADPVIPKGTAYNEPMQFVQPPANADSAYYSFRDTVKIVSPQIDKDNGSNNWAVAGSKTKSGYPILCNDPHLGLNLPALWYEVQISTPTFNVYGASLPGAPAVIIGFNDSIAWGVTNASRDVLDYYSIEFRDGTKTEYLLNGKWVPAERQVEKHVIKGGGVFYDTVYYTVFGPVTYDETYNGNGRVAGGARLSMKWKAHEASNEFKTFNLLNKARNYEDYLNAIRYFECPGQNFVFASSSGDIALWHQGSFPAKWQRQGDFIMPGTDSSYMWQGDIPHNENPHQLNPSRGFVSSANQVPADTSYPYYLNSEYDVYRGVAINRFLDDMDGITVEDMQRLQNENYNAFAASALPFLLKRVDTPALTAEQRKYFTMINTWKFRNDNDEVGPTIFTVWMDVLEQMIWQDEFTKVPAPTEYPSTITLMDLLKKDSAFVFADNVNTPEHETVEQVVTAAFQKACTTLMYTERDGRLKWTKFKDAGIRHLLRMEQLSRFHLNTGGGVHVINATKQFHGPSWKMIVQMGPEIEAYGVYPGGQNGNPGCRGYDEFVDDWAAGKYYKLWMMKKTETGDRRVRGNIMLK